MDKDHRTGKGDDLYIGRFDLWATKMPAKPVENDKQENGE